MYNCLIISHARSGSSNLCRSIAKANNLVKCFEPFGKKEPSLLYKSCTKVIMYRRPVEFFYQLAKRYEKVVLLARRDALASAESLIYLSSSRTSDVDIKWTHLTEKQKKLVPLYHNHIKIDQKNLNTLSELLDIPIDYYEDVYSKYTLKDSSIKLDTQFFHPSKKCKIEKFNLI